MKLLKNKYYTICFINNSYKYIDNFLKKKNISKIILLIDNNIKHYCLPYILLKLPILNKKKIINIKSGEKEKNIFNCIKIWKILEKEKIDRKSLLINIGGGVITDIGGFISSVFKRGIRFFHIPTTLLGMVDASIGGKNGINFESIKNEIGVFNYPDLLIIDSFFLKTLPLRQIKSGLCEILKHGLIFDKKLWFKTKKYIFKKKKYNLINLIYNSCLVKNNIVKKDPKEKNGFRKILNFGHTIGHAIESYFMNTSSILLHGEAVSIGIICESWLSLKKGLKKNQYKDIESTFLKIIPNQMINLCFNKILFLIKKDKKNEHGKILFSLLKEIGNCSFNQKLKYKYIKNSIFHFKKIFLKNQNEKKRKNYKN